MTVVELVERCRDAGAGFQRHINAFVDEFRRSRAPQRRQMIAEGPACSGPVEGLVAAVVSALCREVDIQPAAWVKTTHSPEPFFAFPARGFALRLRLMLESPPPFRARNVFVPDDYLSRA